MAEVATGVPASLSKRRYAELERVLRASETDAEAVTRMLHALCRVLSFDPTASGYTPSRAASIRAWRERKKAATGAPQAAPAVAPAAAPGGAAA